MSSRVLLVHWKAAEAPERLERLRRSGYGAERLPVEDSPALREAAKDPPAAVVIDLSRLPSHGRDLALFFRNSKATRRTPLVFVDGREEKLAAIRKLLPDAVFTTWDRIDGDLKEAIANPPREPVTPPSPMSGYSGTPLPKKLGVKAGSRVALMNPPEGFERVLGPLPEGATVRLGRTPGSSLTIWFCRSQSELESGIGGVAASLEKGAGVWIAWPKKASPKTAPKIATDLSQAAVRGAGLAAGLVDYKVCAIDAVWSGLLFTHRRAAG